LKFVEYIEKQQTKGAQHFNEMNHSPQFYTEYIMLVWFMIGFEIWKRITKHWCTQTYYWCWQAM